jgi:hypothetical protein
VAISLTALFAHERHENVKLSKSIDFLVVEKHDQEKR